MRSIGIASIEPLRGGRLPDCHSQIGSTPAFDREQAHSCRWEQEIGLAGCRRVPCSQRPPSRPIRQRRHSTRSGRLQAPPSALRQSPSVFRQMNDHSPAIRPRLDADCCQSFSASRLRFAPAIEIGLSESWDFLLCRSQPSSCHTRLRRDVGGQTMSEVLFRCPSCGSTETPKLIVRGSGMRASGVSHECRSCNSEWDLDEVDRSAA
jgi:hypothetical protein